MISLCGASYFAPSGKATKTLLESTVAPCRFPRLNGAPIGVLPRNRLAVSATGGASAVSRFGSGLPPTVVRGYVFAWCLESTKEKRERIGSATESAAADSVREAVLSTDLPKKPLSKLAEKQFWQVCAFTPTRTAQAAAVREARRSSTAKPYIHFRLTSELICMSQRES